MTEIQGKSILVRVSARFELTRIRVIGSQLYNTPRIMDKNLWINLQFVGLSLNYTMPNPYPLPHKQR